MDLDSITLERQLLKTDEISYYSCRAPNDHYFLLAKSEQIDLARKITVLRVCQDAFLKSTDFPSADKCQMPQCAFRRSCPRISFLPRISDRIRFEAKEFLPLEFDCLDFRHLFYAGDLLKDFYITVPTAYRLTIGLLIFVDRMVRMNMKVDLRVENLLIDAPFAMTTLVDWSKTEIFDILSFEDVAAMYRQMAEIIFQLTRAEKINGHWCCPAGFDDKRMQTLFEILEDVRQTKIEIPDTLSEAIMYTQALRKKQRGLVREISDSLIGVKFETGKPLFESKKLEAC